MESTEKQYRKRDAILACLRASHAHPSAELLYQDLHAAHPDISLATVYRNLSLFKSQGLIASLGTVNGIERFDGNAKPHVHFVCSCCGDVQDLPQFELPVCAGAQAISDSGHRIDSCQLTFTGCCRACITNQQKNNF